MTVGRMIKELQKYDAKAEVRLHGWEGKKALFVVACTNRPELHNTVVIEDISDNDMYEELSAMFDYAGEKQLDELDFFMDLIEIGITLDDIKKFVPDKYDYSKQFMEEHGMI